MPIGFGLYLSHGFGVIINPSAIIGNNCVISQFVTIGANKGNAAIIGDRVFIGPNSCIVENVKVGSKSVIGAGSIVVKDIKEEITAAGNPAKEISRNNSDPFILNVYEREHLYGMK